jgi:hypothetical protein
MRHGTPVEDLVTGFKGVVTGTVQYITGCNQCLVQPRVAADGAYRESMWIDEQRLKVLEETPVRLPLAQEDEQPAAVGWDKPAPRR